MVYQGGKRQIAKSIMAEMLKYRTDEDTFVDLFCGGGAVAIEATKHFDRVLANDKHPYIIALLQAVKDGWEPPLSLDERQYKSLKSDPAQNPPLAGFAGFGCSFGGKWMGGYARRKAGETDPTAYAAAAAASLNRDRSSYSKMIFSNLDYRDLVIPPKSIIYADPPYANTTSYNGKEFLGEWDIEHFWEYMRQISKEHLVFVSEEDAPNDFISIWNKPQRRQMGNNNKTQPIAMEHLFVQGGV